MEEVDLLRQVAEAPIGGEEITHKARHLQARRYGNTTAPNLQHSFTPVSTAIRRIQVLHWQVLLQIPNSETCRGRRDHVSTVSHDYTGKQVDVLLYSIILLYIILCSITAVWCSTDSEGGDERLVELCFEGVKKTKPVDVDEQ